jgi:hypothetical protein
VQLGDHFSVAARCTGKRVNENEASQLQKNLPDYLAGERWRGALKSSERSRRTNRPVDEVVRIGGVMRLHRTKWDGSDLKTGEGFAIKLMHTESAGMVLHLPVRRRIAYPRRGGS